MLFENQQFSSMKLSGYGLPIFRNAIASECNLQAFPKLRISISNVSSFLLKCDINRLLKSVSTFSFFPYKQVYPRNKLVKASWLFVANSSSTNDYCTKTCFQYQVRHNIQQYPSNNMKMKLSHLKINPTSLLHEACSQFIREQTFLRNAGANAESYNSRR